MLGMAERIIPFVAWTPGPWEIVIIVVAILILFGGRKIPELARGVGRGLREFKREMRGVKQDLEEAADSVEKDDEYEPEPPRRRKKRRPKPKPEGDEQAAAPQDDREPTEDRAE